MMKGFIASIFKFHFSNLGFREIFTRAKIKASGEVQLTIKHTTTSWQFFWNP